MLWKVFVGDKAIPQFLLFSLEQRGPLSVRLFYFGILAASEGNRRPGPSYLPSRLWVILLFFSFFFLLQLVLIFLTANDYVTHCSQSSLRDSLAVFGCVSVSGATVTKKKKKKMPFQTSSWGPRSSIATLGAVQNSDSTTDTTCLCNNLYRKCYLQKKFPHSGVPT